MTKVNLGIIGGGQLGSLLAVAAKKLKIKTLLPYIAIKEQRRNIFKFNAYSLRHRCGSNKRT